MIKVWKQFGSVLVKLEQLPEELMEVIDGCERFAGGNLVTYRIKLLSLLDGLSCYSEMMRKIIIMKIPMQQNWQCANTRSVALDFLFSMENFYLVWRI